MKTFAAITVGDYVLFTVQAVNSVEAHRIVASVKQRSETVERVRLLRPNDMGLFGAPITQR